MVSYLHLESTFYNKMFCSRERRHLCRFSCVG